MLFKQPDDQPQNGQPSSPNNKMQSNQPPFVSAAKVDQSTASEAESNQDSRQAEEELISICKSKARRPDFTNAAFLRDLRRDEKSAGVPTKSVSVDLSLIAIAASAGATNAMNILADVLRLGYGGFDKNEGLANKLYERAAERGDICAMYTLATLLVAGQNGIPADPPRAVALYEHAAHHGDIDSVTNLAALLGTGAKGVARDAPRAKRLYEGAVEENCVVAMRNLGYMLWHGAPGVRRNTPRAKVLLEKAAESGCLESMNSLARLLMRGGDGIPKDMVGAKVLFERAAAKGDVHAKVNLALMLQYGEGGLEKNVPRAMEIYVSAAEQGSVDAVNKLAAILLEGDEGVPRDMRKAKDLLERSSKAGSTEAMNVLADILMVGGEGVEKDAVRAKSLYQLTVQKGNVAAVFNLARLYHVGSDDVPKNPSEAKVLYETAIDYGNMDAAHNLAFLLENGDEGVTKDAPRAKKLYELAVKNGNVSSQTFLARLLMKGDEGVPKQLRRAKNLYEKAASQGDATAMNNLAVLLEFGAEGVGKNVARAMELYESAVKKSYILAVINLAALLVKGGAGVLKDPPRAKQILEDFLKKADLKGKVLVMNALADLLLRGERGVERNVGRAKTLYEQAVDCAKIPATSTVHSFLLQRDGKCAAEDMLNLKTKELYGDALKAAAVNAMYNLGVVLEDVPPMDAENKERALRLFVHAASGGHKKAGEKVKVYLLELAFSLVLNDPEVLDEDFILRFVRAENVRSTTDLLAGHNIVLLALRLGCLQDIHKIGGHESYLVENLYAPGRQFACEKDLLVQAVFDDAEKLCIVTKKETIGFQWQSRKELDEMKQGSWKTFMAFAERTTSMETGVCRSGNFVASTKVEVPKTQLEVQLEGLSMSKKRIEYAVRLSSFLKGLRAATASGDERRMRTLLIRSVLSYLLALVSAEGTSAGGLCVVFPTESASDTDRDLEGCKHRVCFVTGVVDWSCLKTARRLLLEGSLWQLKGFMREGLDCCVRHSGFTGIEGLQELFPVGERLAANVREAGGESLEGAGQEDKVEGATSKTSGDVAEEEGVGRKSATAAWDSGEEDDGASQAREDAERVFAQLCGESAEQTVDLETGRLGVNMLLEGSGLCAASALRVEDAFFAVSGADDEAVCAAVFARMYARVRRERAAVARAFRARFRRRAGGGGGAAAAAGDGRARRRISVRLGERVVRNFLREIGEGGAGGGEGAVGEVVRECGRGGDGYLGEEEMMKALRVLLADGACRNGEL